MDRGPVLPLAGEQFLRRRGVGELLDGAVDQADLPLDRAPTVPGRQECGRRRAAPGSGRRTDGLAATANRTGPQPTRPRARVQVPRAQDTQAAALLGDAPLSGFAQVVPEVLPVRNLDRLRGTSRGVLGKERRAVPAHDLDTGPLGKPGG